MLVKRAEEFAKLVHCHQSYGELPYIYHLREVYLTLLDFGVIDEKILAASWLHDSVEDTETTYDTLLIQFGKEVADLVLAVTNEKGSNRKEILEKTSHKIRWGVNEKALTIKLADRIVNTKFSLENNPKLYLMYEREFSRFKELLYWDWTTEFIVIYLWKYLENLYQPEDERLSLDEVQEKTEKLYVRNCEIEKENEEWCTDFYMNQPESEYYDDCYQIVKERMYDL